MAQIPTGEFGRSVPQIGQTPVARSVDGGLAEAGQRLGATITGVADDQLALDKKRRDAADKVQTLTAHANIQNGLADYYDGLAADVTSGKVKREDAQKAWDSTSAKILDDNLKAVKPEMQQLMRAQLGGLTGQLNNRLQDAFRARDQQDIGGGLVTYREQQQRFAGTDSGTAIKQWDTYVDQMGPSAGWKPERIVAEKQNFKEQVKYTEGFKLITGSQDSIKGLESVRKRLNSDEFLDVDPQKRAAMDASINSRITTLETRAANQAEASARKQLAEFTTFQSFANSGRPPSAEYAVATASRFKGTPYEGAVNAMLSDAQSGTGFSGLPVGQQSAALLQASSELNTKGADPAKLKQYEKMSQVHDAVMRDIKEDGLTASVNYGQNRALQPLQPDLKTLPQQLASRVEAADRATVWAGKPVAPLTKAEASQLATLMESLGPKEKATALAGVRNAIGGTKLGALASLMNDKDPTFAIGAGMASNQTTLGRNVAELYFGGKRVLAEGRLKMDSAKETGTKAMAYEALNGVYATSKGTDQAADAVIGVYAQLRSEGESDSSAMRKAVNFVTGGVVNDYNGAKVALPYGKTEVDLRDAIKSVSPAMLATQSKTFRVGKSTLTPEALSAQLPNLQLGTKSNGIYAVKVGGVPVTKDDGQTLYLNLNGASSDVR